MQDSFRHRSMALAGPALGVALAIAACGGNNATPTAPVQPSADAQATQAGGAGSGAEVSATEKEFQIDVSSASAAPGPITFHVTNSGTQVHEFVVVKTDAKGDALPTASGGTKVQEDATGVTVVDEIGSIAVGASEDLDVTLEPGHYVLICNIPGHYALGMHTDFTVGP